MNYMHVIAESIVMFEVRRIVRMNGIRMRIARPINEWHIQCTTIEIVANMKALTCYSKIDTYTICMFN